MPVQTYGKNANQLAHAAAGREMTTVMSKATQRHSTAKPVARILTSRDGGPVRRIVSGLHTKYTGFFVSVKADFAQMPWESRKGEKTAMVLAEASARVVTFLAQPHRLEISIKEQKAPLKYFPDLQLKVHPSLVEDLLRGVPYSSALLSPSRGEADDNLKTLIVEIKCEDDRRQHAPKYKRKLELAEQVYERMGITFLTIRRDEDIFPGDLRIASGVVSWRHTAVTQLDVWAVEGSLRRSDRSAADVVMALGGGPLGWAKLRALHVRRIVEMDLTEAVTDGTAVRLRANNSRHVRVRS